MLAADESLLRWLQAQQSCRPRRSAPAACFLGGAARPCRCSTLAGRDRVHGGGAGGGAELAPRRFVRLRGEQVADDPAHHSAAGDAGHHDGNDSGDGSRSRRGGAADARRGGQAGAGAADRRRVSACALAAKLHASWISYLRRRLPKPQQRGGPADGVHDGIAPDRDRGSPQCDRSVAEPPAAEEATSSVIFEQKGTHEFSESGDADIAESPGGRGLRRSDGKPSAHRYGFPTSRC